VDVALQPRDELRRFLDGFDQERDQLLVVDGLEAGGGLVLAVGPDGARSFTLTHFDRDVFAYRPYDETPDLPVAATFAIGPDQRATHLTLDDLNDHGQGVLARVSQTTPA